MLFWRLKIDTLFIYFEYSNCSIFLSTNIIKKNFYPGWFSYLFLLFIFLALRKNIGGDWTNYAYILESRIDDFNPLKFSYRSDIYLNLLYG